MDCKGCNFTCFEFLKILDNKDSLLKFLEDHNIIRKNVVCPTCQNLAVFNKNDLFWRCQKSNKKQKGKKTFVVKCNFKLALKTGTWFERCALALDVACKFIAWYVFLPPPREAILMKELSISSKTYVDWSNFIREAIFLWCINNSTDKLGGPDKIVEIDEAKFGKRKYHRGRFIEGVWLFGGFCRETRDIFIVPVADRSSKTLLSVITEKIAPGTIIMSDCWKAYNCLTENGFEHLTVNHTYNFVDPDTGAHTQHIERTWRDTRAAIPAYGRREDHMDGYIAEYLFKRKFKDFTERFHKIFEVIQFEKNPNESAKEQ